MSSQFYRTSNSAYGEHEIRPIDRGSTKAKKLERKLADSKAVSSGAYGEETLHAPKGFLFDLMDEYLDSKRFKVSTKKPKKTPKDQIYKVKVDLTKFRHEPKKQNLLKTTTANEIGNTKPNPETDGPGYSYPHSNTFTKSFVEMYRETGLQT